MRLLFKDYIAILKKTENKEIEEYWFLYDEDTTLDELIKVGEEYTRSEGFSFRYDDLNNLVKTFKKPRNSDLLNPICNEKRIDNFLQ